jgi:hypothetical protein
MDNKVKMVGYKPIIFGIVVTVLLGLISIFTSFFGFFVQIILGTSAIIIGGFVAAYITDGDYKDGGVNGAMAGVFGVVLLGFVIMLFTFHYDGVYWLLIELFITVIVGSIIGFNFGLLGAVIGNKIKKNPPLTPGMDNGYLVCNKCKSYYELKEGEFPEDYDNECDCGGKLEYKKSNKPDFKLILHYKVLGIGIILFIIGIIMLSLVFQLQIKAMLRISVIILGIGLFAISMSIMKW